MNTQPAVVDQSDLHNAPPGTTGGASTDPTDPTPVVNPMQINPAEVPEYERQIAAGTSLDKGNQGGDTVAHVATNVLPSRTVSVDDPTAYTAADQAHELQHVVQNSNTPLIQKVKNAFDPNNATLAGVKSGATGAQTPYGYGGTEGLAKHIASGKTVSDLNAEQQASIPQNYMKEYVKAEKAGDAKAIDRLNQVYGPVIQQLRNMVNPSNDSINTNPAAPGPPPAALTGLAKALPGMLSRSTQSVDLKDVHNPPGAKKKKDTNGR